MDPFAPWLQRWGLTQDGWPFQTPYTRSLLLPVRQGDAPAMLKLAGSPEERRGAALMAWWAGEGAAPVLAHEDEALLLVRASDAEALPRLAFDGDDDGATTILCQLAATLHRPRPAPPPETLTPLARWLADLERASAQGGPYADAWAAVAPMLAAPRDVAVLHGDLTHANVLHFGAAGWLAIDPKGLVGERGYDFANIFRSPTVSMATPQRFRRQLALVARLTGLDRDRLLAWAIGHGAIAVAWAERDGHKVGRALDYVRMALAVRDAP